MALRPKLTLCHGSVVGIGWPASVARKREGDAFRRRRRTPSAATVKVAFGNTIAETLAALGPEHQLSTKRGVLEHFSSACFRE
jgi:hypothetical protein